MSKSYRQEVQQITKEVRDYRAKRLAIINADAWDLANTYEVLA